MKCIMNEKKKGKRNTRCHKDTRYCQNNGSKMRGTHEAAPLEGNPLRRATCRLAGVRLRAYRPEKCVPATRGNTATLPHERRHVHTKPQSYSSLLESAPREPPLTLCVTTRSRYASEARNFAPRLSLLPEYTRLFPTLSTCSVWSDTIDSELPRTTLR